MTAYFCTYVLLTYVAVSHIGINGPKVVPVGSNVTFSIQLLSNDEVIFILHIAFIVRIHICIIHLQILPSDMVYTWSFTNHIVGTAKVATTNQTKYCMVFSTAGTYEVSVLGVYTGGSFTTSYTIIIRS